jgi:hypothetical protein
MNFLLGSSLQALLAALLTGFMCTMLAGVDRDPQPARTQFRIDQLVKGFAVRIKLGLVTGLSLAVGFWFAASQVAIMTRLVLGLVFSATIVLGFAVAYAASGPLDTKSVIRARDLLRLDRNHCTVLVILLGIGGAFAFSLLAGWMAGLTVESWGGIAPAVKASVPVGAALAIVVALTIWISTAWGQWLVVARFWLPLTGRLPWRIIAFLDDANQRGALRQVGAVYQFRHSRLQEYLAGPSFPCRRRRHWFCSHG